MKRPSYGSCPGSSCRLAAVALQAMNGGSWRRLPGRQHRLRALLHRRELDRRQPHGPPRLRRRLRDRCRRRPRGRAHPERDSEGRLHRSPSPRSRARAASSISSAPARSRSPPGPSSPWTPSGRPRDPRAPDVCRRAPEAPVGIGAGTAGCPRREKQCPGDGPVASGWPGSPVPFPSPLSSSTACSVSNWPSRSYTRHAAPRQVNASSMDTRRPCPCPHRRRQRLGEELAEARLDPLAVVLVAVMTVRSLPESAATKRRSRSRC